MAGYEESISIEEIRELALRYIGEDECGALIYPKDVFAMRVRPLSQKAVFGKKKNNDWLFAGYGLLLDYKINPDEKPYGKWITVKFLNLTVFPPSPAEFRLQPPHIAKGYFQNFDRTSETFITPVFSPQAADISESENDKNEKEAEILKFPGDVKD